MVTTICSAHGMCLTVVYGSNRQIARLRVSAFIFLIPFSSLNHGRMHVNLWLEYVYVKKQNAFFHG